jgi:hypothetical protein
MAEDPEVPEEFEELEEISLAQLAEQMPDVPTPLRELAIATHEMYIELESVGFPARQLNQIMALMLSDVVTGRIFEEEYEVDGEWTEVGEGDINDDGDEPE